MGKKNFTLICRACIFWQAFEKEGVFKNTPTLRFCLQFIRQRLFGPILDSEKPYCQSCKRMKFSFAELWLGFFCFDGWGCFLSGLTALLKPVSRTRQVLLF